MVRRLLFVASCLVLAACSNSLPPTAPQTTAPASTLEARAENEFFPLSMFTFVPCADAGAGEGVQLDGTLHVLTRVSSDRAGGFHLEQHYNPQGVTGVGLVTGDKYQGTGVTRMHVNLKAGVTETYVNNFRIIGQRTGNNYLVHATFHITVNANGEVSTEFYKSSTDCR